MTTICTAMAHACSGDQLLEARWLKEGLSWSARNRMDIVRRKTCPDKSCPFLNLGRTLSFFPTSEEVNTVPLKNIGCVSGVNVDLVKQNSCGTERLSPEGRYAIHSPPEKTVKRSRIGGPKNQLMKRIQMRVSERYLKSLSRVRTADGLERKVNPNTAVVHPQAYLMKYTLSGLDLEAK